MPYLQGTDGTGCQRTWSRMCELTSFITPEASEGCRVENQKPSAGRLLPMRVYPRLGQLRATAETSAEIRRGHEERQEGWPITATGELSEELPPQQLPSH